MSKEIILQVSGLSKAIKGIPILSDFGIEVFRGDICGIVGPNGSGKTMLLRMITTLVNPDKGEIRIFGKKLAVARKKILEQIGLMVGEPVFYDHLNAFDNISIFSKYAGVDKDNDEIDRILKLTGLLSLADTKVKHFASGDRKKLAIAMALYNNPMLVILDEPFRSLDVKSLIEIKKVIKTINQERGTTFLIATKRLGELEGFITRIALIDGGRLIAEGDVDELVGRAKTGLLIETDDNERAYKLLRESNLSIDNIIVEGSKLRVSCQKETVPFINKYLIESNVQVFVLQSDDAISSYYLTFTE